MVLWVIIVVQLVIAWSAPSTLFGHWKDDHYKDKLEWDAFTHFLSDMAMIRKYAPEDLPMWGDWLVYGTALGVGDKVEQAMKALNIPVADTGVPLGVMGMSSVFMPISTFMPVSQGFPWRVRGRRFWRRLWWWRRVRWWRGRGKISRAAVPPLHRQRTG